MRKFSIGMRVVPWIYDRQLEGKMLWVPIGESSGFYWMAFIDIVVAVVLGLILGSVWMLL